VFVRRRRRPKPDVAAVDVDTKTKRRLPIAYADPISDSVAYSNPISDSIAYPNAITNAHKITVAYSFAKSSTTEPIAIDARLLRNRRRESNVYSDIRGAAY